MDQVLTGTETHVSVAHDARSSRRPRLVVFLLAIASLYLAATVVRIYVRNYYVFVPDYLRWTAIPSETAPQTHLFVLMADHFEPAMQVGVTERWIARYAEMARRHRDADGRVPQHTWFYPGEQYEPRILQLLRGATARGLGEVELHFHHDNDTQATLRDKLVLGITQFQQFGFLRTVDGRTAFGFVHGNFGLDNSGGPIYCGVNSELALLRELGAYADFTFPAVYTQSQPHEVNTLYAAKDDAEPFSYNRPLPLDALRRSADADLLIFQGPLVFAPSLQPRRLFLDLDDGNIHQAKPASTVRIPRWLRANVHVPGHPDWMFIKLFSHGATSPGDIDAVTGSDYDQMLHGFETQYNDGSRYVLHYVTAREAFNLVMAAVDGHSGDPRPYFDYRVKPYVANVSSRGTQE